MTPTHSRPVGVVGAPAGRGTTGGGSRGEARSAAGAGGQIASANPAPGGGVASTRRPLPSHRRGEPIYDAAPYIALVRRLRQRWSLDRIAAAVGVCDTRIYDLSRGTPVWLEASTARRLDRAEAALARHVATPPRLGPRYDVDVVAVRRALSGTPVADLTSAERREVVRCGRHLSARQLADVLGVTRRTVVRYRSEATPEPREARRAPQPRTARRPPRAVERRELLARLEADLVAAHERAERQAS